MKTISYWTVELLTNEYRTETIGMFENEQDAIDLANMNKSKGWYGSNASVYGHVLNIYESFEDFKQTNTEAIKRSALAKLTEAEKKALGL